MQNNREIIQNKCIEKFKENKSGILSLATGVGKTKVAIDIIEYLK